MQQLYTIVLVVSQHIASSTTGCARQVVTALRREEPEITVWSLGDRRSVRCASAQLHGRDDEPKGAREPTKVLGAGRNVAHLSEMKDEELARALAGDREAERSRLDLCDREVTLGLGLDEPGGGSAQRRTVGMDRHDARRLPCRTTSPTDVELVIRRGGHPEVPTLIDRRLARRYGGRRSRTGIFHARREGVRVRRHERAGSRADAEHAQPERPLHPARHDVEPSGCDDGRSRAGRTRRRCGRPSGRRVPPCARRAAP